MGLESPLHCPGAIRDSPGHRVELGLLFVPLVHIDITDGSGWGGSGGRQEVGTHYSI